MSKSITQKMKYRQTVVKFSYKYGVKKAAIKFNEWPKTIYRWRERTYPGEKIQVDVTYVPKKCLSPELQEQGVRFYEYTAIDEYTRKRYLWYTEEHSTYTSAILIKRLVRYFKFNIKTIQTDNGLEFTNRLNWNSFDKNKKTMFEKLLEELGIKHKLIKPHTPKQNGKVERSHRKDQERFYYNKVFYSLEDLRNRGRDRMKEYNNFAMKPLKWLSPNEMLKLYESQVALV